MPISETLEQSDARQLAGLEEQLKECNVMRRLLEMQVEAMGTLMARFMEER